MSFGTPAEFQITPDWCVFVGSIREDASDQKSPKHIQKCDREKPKYLLTIKIAQNGQNGHFVPSRCHFWPPRPEMTKKTYEFVMK
jgi:hypothetical protein